MARQETLDITRFIDERKMSGFNAKVVIFCFFIMLFDGYDIGAVAFAGPSLVKAWRIEQHGGARHGVQRRASSASCSARRSSAGSATAMAAVRAIVASCMVIGMFSLLTMAAGSLTELIVLRFLTGIGIGGMLPNTIALNAEYAPRRVPRDHDHRHVHRHHLRRRGAGAGRGLARADYGWQVLFLIGGMAPLVVGLAAWLCGCRNRSSISSSRPGGATRPCASSGRWIPRCGSTRARASSSPTRRSMRASARPSCSADGLRWITPLLWVCFICNLMSFYFLNSWLPTVLSAAHVPVSHAALSTSVFQVGGTLGGLALSRPIDRMGLAPVCGLFVLSFLIAPFVGYAESPEWLLMVAIFLAGFTLLGLQFGLNATSAMIYPTSIRSNGSGWAFAVGRFGSVAGPIVAGVLIGMRLSIEHLFLFLLVPLFIGTVCSFVLARLYYLRFEGMGLGRRDTMDAAGQQARG